jgi:hypothetical protein
MKGERVSKEKKTKEKEKGEEEGKLLENRRTRF